MGGGAKEGSVVGWQVLVFALHVFDKVVPAENVYLTVKISL